MPRLVHIATVPASLMFVAGQVDFLKERGFEVVAVTSPGPMLHEFGHRHGIAVHAVEMTRAISPRADVGALARLTDLLLDLSPDIVHSHTPKGGLLGMLAARAAMVPVRVYQMRGLVYPTATGARRRLLIEAERTTCRAAHWVVCQSPSLRREALSRRLVGENRSSVIANGSNGVDAEGRFNPEHVTGLDVRAELGIGADDPVIGFVGRLVRDKGIVELTDAWRAIKGEFPSAHLLVVGPFEQRDALPVEIERALRDDPRVHLVGFRRDTPRFYEAMDVHVLPSHREGFPNAPLEAAAMAVPTVTTDALGCVDAVSDGVTGTVVPVGDAMALRRAVAQYLRDPVLRAEHGSTARARALEMFQPQAVWQGTLDLYERLLGERSR